MIKKDNLPDLQRKYEELGTEIEALEQKQSWPKAGDRYFYVRYVNSHGPSISHHEWQNDDVDRRYRTAGNCYRTCEEAHAKAEQIKAVFTN